MRRAALLLAATIVIAAGSTACGSTPSPTVEAAPSTSVPSTTVSAAADPPTRERGRDRQVVDATVRPVAADRPVALADQIVAAERAIRDPATSPDQLAGWGHTQQVAYAALAARPRWDDKVARRVPDDLQLALAGNLSARRTSAALLPTEPATELPAWRIVAPEPTEDLLAHYRDAEAATGIEWEYLAAINLMETRMGRIVGDSSAGAQGPMQFLPATWEEDGIGRGDIYDPADAIAAAARYLVRRGGPADMAEALYGYNNSDSYVNAVEQYAAILRDDPRAYHGFHQWQVYYATAEGAVWLQEGYDQSEPISVLAYLADHPAAAPTP